MLILNYLFNSAKYISFFTLIEDIHSVFYSKLVNQENAIGIFFHPAIFSPGNKCIFCGYNKL